MSIGREKKGILLESNNEIAVYGLNQVRRTTDAFLALPTDILGTRYLAVGSEPSSNLGSQYLNIFSVIATCRNTTLRIVPKVRLRMYKDKYQRWVYHNAHEPLIIKLNRLETYTVRSFGDITGSLVESDKPIALISGHECAYVPDPIRYCDHLIEQVSADTLSLFFEK